MFFESKTNACDLHHPARIKFLLLLYNKRQRRQENTCSLHSPNNVEEPSNKETDVDDF